MRTAWHEIGNVVTSRSILTFSYQCLVTCIICHFDKNKQDDDPQQRLLHEAIKDDSLRKIDNERQMLAEKTILTTAKLIAPVIESSFAVGFDWCIENVMESQYSDLASELEITKGLTFLKQSDIPRVRMHICM